MPVDRQKQLGAVDAHWAAWQKRHRGPRAIDLYRKNQESKLKTATPELARITEPSRFSEPPQRSTKSSFDEPTVPAKKKKQTDEY